jgi:GntR family transcriptional regulator of gluconate operon
MSAGFTPIRRAPFGEQVTEHLRNSIVRGEFPVGERLVEEQLATRFGVSRGPVRDALRRLEIEGLVESRGAGTYVIGIAEADINELYSLREAIETLAADLVMERSTDEDWAEMAALVDALDRAAQAQDREAFAVADAGFHSMIYAHSGHRRLRDIWHQYAPILSTLMRTTVLADDNLQKSADVHRVLLDVLRKGDHAAAAAELRRHLEGSRQNMLAAHRSLAGRTATDENPPRKAAS